MREEQQDKKVRRERKAREAEKAMAQEYGMVRVPGGKFEIGCKSKNSYCFENEFPSQKVRVRTFEIGKREVTVGQFRKFVEKTGYRTESESGKGCYALVENSWKLSPHLNWRNPGFPQKDSHPVVCVNWYDVQAMLEWMNDTGKGLYRLPTEIEWEYACRSGGKPETYCGGKNSSRLAWEHDNSKGRTHPVGKKASNGLGLYDMSGNAIEWTCSKRGWYDFDKYYYSKCRSESPSFVIKGGGWNSHSFFIRASFRIDTEPANSFNELGFRLAKTVN